MNCEEEVKEVMEVLKTRLKARKCKRVGNEVQGVRRR